MKPIETRPSILLPRASNDLLRGHDSTCSVWVVMRV
jgi:hypothetical protein